MHASPEWPRLAPALRPAVLWPAAAVLLVVEWALWQSGGLGEAVGTSLCALAAVLAFAAPLSAALALFLTRPLTEPFWLDRKIPLIGGHHVQLQQLWGFLLIVAILRLFVRWRVDWRKPVYPLVVGVAAAGVLGALAGPVTSWSIKQWAWVVLSLLCLPLGMEAARRVPVDRFVWAMLGAAYITLLLVAADPYGHTKHVPVPVSQAGAHSFHVRYVSQISGDYSSIHTLAFAAVALVVWAGAAFLAVRSRRGRVLAGVAVIGLVAVILLSTSRTAEVGLAIVAAGLVVGCYPRIRGRLGRGTIWTVLAVAVVLIAVPFASHNVRTRWREIPYNLHAHGLAWAGSGRGYLWKQAAIDWKNASVLRKVVGSGLYSDSNLTKERTGTAFAAHSDGVELLVSVGVLGLALYVALLAYVGVQLARARRLLRRTAWLWPVGVGAAFSFVAMGLLTGFIRYTSASAVGLLAIGYVIGFAKSGETGRAAVSRTD